MKFSLDEYVQRELHYAIVDEVDNILIDEARTPLIISGPAEQSSDLYYSVNRIIPRLTREVDYTIDEKHRNAMLTEEGVAKCERLLGVANLYDPSQIDTLHHVTQALKAHTLFKRDVDYVVKDGEVIIVDEFTGRLMPGPALVRRAPPGGGGEGGRSRSRARTRPSPPSPSRTTSACTRSSRGMTGTADTEAVEFQKIYKLDVVVIPPNKQMRRVDHPDVVYKSEREKFDAVVEEIAECHAEGPAGAGRHDLGGEVGARLEAPQEGGHQAQRAERHQPRGRGQHHRPGRSPRAGHHRHQHGRPRHRHPARRQPGVPGARRDGERVDPRLEQARRGVGRRGALRGRAARPAREVRRGAAAAARSSTAAPWPTSSSGARRRSASSPRRIASCASCRRTAPCARATRR